MAKATGINCKVCSLGEIVQVTEYHPRSTGEVKVNSHLHCNVCGVRYEFLPEQNLRKPEPFAGMTQVRPNLWSGRTSSSIFEK